MLRARFIDSRRILISNDGGRRARIANLSQDGRTVIAGLIGYALAHSRLEVLLPSPVHPGAIALETDGGSRDVEIR
jgi:hypothetical protein